MKSSVTLAIFTGIVAFSLVAYGQDQPAYECDNRFGACGTPEQSGGGNNSTSMLIAGTDLGDTYQYADDYDDDGVEDPYDNCLTVKNADQADSDGDGFGNACDNCIDRANEDQHDLDGDGQGDVCDEDPDGDGLIEDDNCPNVANPVPDGGSSQTDTNGDGEGDACDDDDDGDGVADLDDNCPLIVNPDQEVISDAGCYNDSDGDGTPDHLDNCLLVSNDQNDIDGDGLGDECDANMDDDAFPNDQDNCPMVAQDSQVDSDRDGQGDECDNQFCYVVDGDQENCLDVEGSFTIYTPDSDGLETGQCYRLRLFANRENAGMEYQWNVQSGPAGANATVNHPYGAVRLSTPYEYHYVEANVPTFCPNEPGEYVVRVVATQVWEDKISGEVSETAEALAVLIVTGDGFGDDCAVAPIRSANRSSLALLTLLGLLGLRRLRRQ
jgi:hypothetical protein